MEFKEKLACLTLPVHDAGAFGTDSRAAGPVPVLGLLLMSLPLLLLGRLQHCFDVALEQGQATHRVPSLDVGRAVGARYLQRGGAEAAVHITRE